MQIEWITSLPWCNPFIINVWLILLTTPHLDLLTDQLEFPGLLLDGHDIQHLVLQGGAEEHVDHLVLLHKEGQPQESEGPKLDQNYKSGHIFATQELQKTAV